MDKLRLTGGGPVFFRLGRAVIYNDRDLDEWIDSRKVASNDNMPGGRGAASADVVSASPEARGENPATATHNEI